MDVAAADIFKTEDVLMAVNYDANTQLSIDKNQKTELAAAGIHYRCKND